jgi:hypothetical protein
MRYESCILLAFLMIVPVQAEDFAKVWDGSSFLVPSISTQPRGTVRTSLSVFNGYNDEQRNLRNEDQLTFVQRFAPRWTRIQFGYLLALNARQSGYELDAPLDLGAVLEIPIGLADEGDLAMAVQIMGMTTLLDRSTNVYDYVSLSFPVSARLWPLWQASVSAGVAYRNANYVFAVRPEQFHTCVPIDEVTLVPQIGGGIEYAAHTNLRLSLEYLHSIYYGEVYGQWRNAWNETRESVAPGVRFIWQEWSLAAGFPFALNETATAEGLMFSLAYQSIGRTRLLR